MVGIVLEACVQDLVMRRDEGVFKAAVQIYAIGVEEQPKLDEEEVHVDGHEEGDEEEGGGSEQLVHRLISNHREGAWVVENVMMSMVIPESQVKVAKPVI